MADQTPAPALPSTADATPYVPVSWMAVAVVGVAGVFVVSLLALGASAFVGKKPLIMPELLVFPVVGVVLSFAARRLIRNSEGTRTGENLANAAWWVSLVGGLAYVAYLLAIEYSIRREATNVVRQWVDAVRQDDANRAFYRTLDPGRRRGVDPQNSAQLLAEFRDPYTAFLQSDVVRLGRRNPGQLEFVPGGLQDWVQRPGGVECVFTGTLKCPEGQFGVSVPLRGIEGAGGPEGAGRREWRIDMPPNGIISPQKISLTPYGWTVAALARSGGQYGQRFVALARQNGPTVFPYYFPESFPAVWGIAADSTHERVAVGGGAGSLAPFFSPAYHAFFRDRFVKLPGGGEPSPEQKAKFVQALNLFGLLYAGERLKTGPDVADLRSLGDEGDPRVPLDVTPTPESVEVRVPFELPLPDGSGAVARGRVVVVCTDPGVPAELKKLRDEARPEQGSSVPPPDLRRQFPWRVVRVETDMTPIKPASQQGGQGGGPDG